MAAFGQQTHPLSSIQMHTATAYERRERLDADKLGRLLFALRDEAARYREAIRGYSADKMARYGAPYLAQLDKRIEEVERLLSRTQSSS